MIRADLFGFADRRVPWGRRAYRPGVEELERLVVPSLAFQFNYSYDSSGYFAAHPAAEQLLAEAGRELGDAIDTDLAAIAPDPASGNTWSAVVSDPSDPGRQLTVSNLSVPANTLIVYVGVSSGDYAGIGGPGGWNAHGTSAWTALVASRGQAGSLAASPTEFGPWGGMISFNVSAAGGPDLGTALHELCHVLGAGTAGSWFTDVDRPTHQFIGAHAEAAHGGPVPLDTSEPGDLDGHWALGTQSKGKVALMTPDGGDGSMTPLDWAGLEDVGWRLTGLPDVAPVVAVDFTTPSGAPLAESTFGQAVAIVASIDPVDASTGTVVFSDGATVMGSASVDREGVATLVTSALHSGPHSITATFSIERGGAPRALTGSEDLWVQPAAPVLSVDAVGGVYDGGPFPAIVTISGAGANAPAERSLEGVTPSLAYYNASTGAAVSSAPTVPGDYVAVAEFAGARDYRAATAQASFTVLPSKALPLGPSAAAFLRSRGRSFIVAITVRFLAAGQSAPPPTGVVTFELVSRKSGRRVAMARRPLLRRELLFNGRATLRLRAARAWRKQIVVEYSGDAEHRAETLVLPALARRSFVRPLAARARRGGRP